MRLTLTLVLVAGIAIGALAGALALALGGAPERPPVSWANDPGPYRGSEPPAGFQLPEFELRDYTGELVNASELDADVFLVTFLDSQCTEACPIIAGQIAQTLDSLAARERARVEAIAFSTDPAGDTSENVRAFLAKQRALGKLRWLTATEFEMRPLWRKFQILSSLETEQDTLHSAPVRIYDHRREWVATLHAGVDLTVENLAHDIRRALKEAS